MTEFSQWLQLVQGKCGEDEPEIWAHKLLAMKRYISGKRNFILLIDSEQSDLWSFFSGFAWATQCDLFELDIMWVDANNGHESPVQPSRLWCFDGNVVREGVVDCVNPDVVPCNTRHLAETAELLMLRSTMQSNNQTGLVAAVGNMGVFHFQLAMLIAVVAMAFVVHIIA